MVKRFWGFCTLHSPSSKRKNALRVGMCQHPALCRFWWYELVYIIRKLFLNGVVIFFPTAGSQLIVSLLFCFLSVCLQLVSNPPQQRSGTTMCHQCAQAVDPYKRKSDNVIQAVVVVQLFLTLFAGMLTLDFWSSADQYGSAVLDGMSITDVCVPRLVTGALLLSRSGHRVVHYRIQLGGRSIGSSSGRQRSSCSCGAVSATACAAPAESEGCKAPSADEGTAPGPSSASGGAQECANRGSCSGSGGT